MNRQRETFQQAEGAGGHRGGRSGCLGPVRCHVTQSAFIIVTLSVTVEGGGAGSAPSSKAIIRAQEEK